MDLKQGLKKLTSLFTKGASPTNSGIFGFFSAQSLPGMKDTEYLKAYRGWVYACVNAIAERMADIEIKLQKIDKSGEWQDVDSHPAMDLLFDVNDFMSFSELVYNHAAYQELDGNTFWYMPQSGSKPQEIWPLDPTKMEVVKSEKNYINGYVYTNEKGTKIPFEPSEIIHFKTFHPRNPYRGMGTVEAAALAIDTDINAAEWQRNFFGNAAMPSGILSSEGTLNQDQYDRIRSNWDSRYQGVQNAHKMAILEGNLKWTAVSPSSREMEFTESRKNTRDEIMAIFRVSKIILGITEDVNLASAEASEYVFAKYVIRPKMKAFIGKLTEFYLPLWGLDQKQYRLFFEDPVPANLDQQRLDRESGIKNYYMTPNEARAEVGLEAVEGGDYLFIPSMYAPLTESAIEEAETPAGDSNSQPEPNIPDDGNTPEDGTNPDENQTGKSKKKINGYTLLPLKSKIKTKKLDAKRKEFFIKAKDQKSNVVNGAIPKLKKTNLELNEKLKSLILTNLQNAKNAPKHEQKGLLQRLKDITNPKDQMVRLLFQNYNDWIGLLHNSTEEGMSKVFEQAGKIGLQQVASNVTFNLQNPRALNHLTNHALENTTSYSDTMKEDIALVIQEAVEQGESVDDMAVNIAQFFDSQSEFRAERLARTETIDAYAQGNLEGYRQSGVVSGKSWLADGEAQDEVCVGNADAGVIDIDDVFPSGDDAPPGHPNCECALQPQVANDS